MSENARTVTITTHDDHGFHTAYAEGPVGHAWACGSSAAEVSGVLFLFCNYGDVEPSGDVSLSHRSEDETVREHKRSQRLRSLAYRQGTTYDAIVDGVYFPQDDLCVEVYDFETNGGRVVINHPATGLDIVTTDQLTFSSDF